MTELDPEKLLRSLVDDRRLRERRDDRPGDIRTRDHDRRGDRLKGAAWTTEGQGRPSGSLRHARSAPPEKTWAEELSSCGVGPSSSSCRPPPARIGAPAWGRSRAGLEDKKREMLDAPMRKWPGA